MVDQGSGCPSGGVSRKLKKKKTSYHDCLNQTWQVYLPTFHRKKESVLIYDIIHHNQLLMTKFGRILCLTRK